VKRFAIVRVTQKRNCCNNNVSFLCSGNETENYAVEEGTQFFDNVKGFWQKVFNDYQFDIALLNF
jgi:hypothetical protein